MSLKSLINNDLATIFGEDADFTDEALHSFGESSESLFVLFDEEYEAVFDNQGYETTSVVPCFILLGSKASNINSSSTFTIEGRVFGVVAIQKENNDITRVILDIR